MDRILQDVTKIIISPDHPAGFALLDSSVISWGSHLLGCEDPGANEFHTILNSHTITDLSVGSEHCIQYNLKYVSWFCTIFREIWIRIWRKVFRSETRIRADLGFFIQNPTKFESWVRNLEFPQTNFKSISWILEFLKSFPNWQKNFRVGNNYADFEIRIRDLNPKKTFLMIRWSLENTRSWNVRCCANSERCLLLVGEGRVRRFGGGFEHARRAQVGRTCWGSRQPRGVFILLMQHVHEDDQPIYRAHQATHRIRITENTASDRYFHIKMHTSKFVCKISPIQYRVGICFSR